MTKKMSKMDIDDGIEKAIQNFTLKCRCGCEVKICISFNVDAHMIEVVEAYHSECPKGHIEQKHAIIEVY